MPKMQILRAPEQEEFDSPPEFDSADRKKHFDFPSGILDLADQLRTPTNKACFLLASGYFSATKKFYSPQQFRQLDIDYVCRKVTENPQEVRSTEYDKQTLRRHEQLIIGFYGFKPFSPQVNQFVQQEMANLVALQLMPRLVFYRVIDLLIREKIAIPSYHRLSWLIVKALNLHKAQLIQRVESHLPAETRILLDGLFDKASDDETQPSSRFHEEASRKPE